MTRTFRDDNGRRWKAWLASRDVFWPDPNTGPSPEGQEAVIFVCFSDPNQTQKRLRLPSGSFEALSADDLVRQFRDAEPDPAIR